ncbi:MAG: DUF2207 domain-containing protein [Desulfovibrio sp.]|nr:DUF2207 domain-containing protein [Desulfovibrio sp.]
MNYVVDARLETDASLVVCETITVAIEHKKIRHGITRSFPLKQIYDERKLRHFDFEVLSVQLDGQDIAYSREDFALMAGLAIGEHTRLAPLGEHTYRISYRTRGHVHHFDGCDELYFNALGLDIQFPVEQASFQLTLPESFQVVTAKAYTGRLGEQGGSVEALGPTAFRTTRPLKAGEAFTVLIDWQPASLPQEDLLAFKNWLGGHRLLAFLACACLLGFFFLMLELRYRFHNRLGGICPEFSPKPELTPGLTACWYKQGFGALALQADLLWLAARGFATLTLEEGGAFALTRKSPTCDKSDWRDNRCLQLVSQLFGSAAIRLFAAKKPGDAGKAANALAKYYRPTIASWRSLDSLGLFLTSCGFVLAFVLLGLLEDLVWYKDMAEFEPFEDVLAGLLLAGLALLCLAYLLFRGYCSFCTRSARPFTGWLCALWFWLLALGLGHYLLTVFLDDWIMWSYFGLSVLLPVFFYCFRHSLPTKAGREIGRHLQGLRLYIRIAEEERLAKINAPRDTVARYEEILPYALALGCAKAWQRRFDPVLAKSGYEPQWFQTPKTVSRSSRSLFEQTISPSSPLASVSKTIYSASSAAQRAAKLSSVTALGRSSSSRSSSSGSSGGSFGGGSGRGSGGGGVGGW